MSIRIQCPNCAQRFTVEDHLKEKMVECGACDHRFRVTDEVEVGTVKKPFKVSKLPSMAGIHSTPVAARQVGNLRPSRQERDPAYINPAKPSQYLAVLLGIFWCVMIWLVFISGSRVGGVLQDMTDDRRWVLVGISCLLVTGLFFYGIRLRRGVALLCSLVFGGSLLLAPVVIPAVITPIAPPVQPGELSSDPGVLQSRMVVVTLPDMKQRPLIERVGYQPMYEAISTHGEGRVIGVMCTEVDELMTEQVARFLHRVLRSKEKPWKFSRDGIGSFYVVAPTGVTYLEAMEALKSLGEITDKSEPELLIEVKVNRDLFTLPPEADLNDPKSTKYYELNAKELQAFDPERVRKAADRLGRVPATQLRADIRARLIQQMMSAVDETSNWWISLSNCLLHWSEVTDAEALPALERAALSLDQKKADVPSRLLNFLLKNQSPKARAVLKSLWEVQPGSYEQLYLLVGGEAEQELLEALKTGTLAQKRSAANILGSIGGVASVEALRQCDTSSDNQLKNEVERSLKSLENKLK